MTTPTTPENVRRINEAFLQMADLLAVFLGRYMDERGHETVNDYRDALQRQLPDGFEIVKMTARPFGFQFTIGTDAVYSMTCTSRNASWKRLA